MIPASKPVTVPERTYDNWGLLSFELQVRPGDVVDVAAVVRRCNKEGWSELDDHTAYLRESDIVAAMSGSPDALYAFGVAKEALLQAVAKLMDLRGVR